ncbi:hypothetical protein FHU30_003764 [Actinomadura rupiterrae]|nr:hypothetical protein [Actinomadura rupiterrae]
MNVHLHNPAHSVNNRLPGTPARGGAGQPNGPAAQGRRAVRQKRVTSSPDGFRGQAEDG